MAKILLGLDLGTHSLKAVVAKATGKGFAVAHAASLPAPAGLLFASPEELRGALKELLQQLGPHPKAVAVAIPSEMALVRRLSLPRLKPQRLRALIESQAAQFIPFYREGAAFDLVVTNPSLSETEQEVLMLAVPLGPLERLRSVLKAVGLRLVAVDLDQQALFRAGVALGALQTDAVCTVLDVGYRGARLGLFQGGWPLLVRTLDSLPDLEGAELSGEIRLESPDSFVVDVRRTLEALLSQGRLPELASLLLANRWTDGHVTALLAEELRSGLERRLLDSFQVIEASGPALPKGMALAFGLSLAAAVRPFHPMLLPRAPIEVQRQRRTAALALLASLVGTGGYGFLWWTEQQATAAEAGRLRAQVSQLNEALAKEPVVAAEEAAWSAFQPFLTMEQAAPTWSSLYPHLKGLIPPGVTLQSVTVSGSTLTIAGNAATPEALAAFVQNLYKSSMVAPPILSNWASETSGQFSITGSLKPRAEVAHEQ